MSEDKFYKYEVSENTLDYLNELYPNKVEQILDDIALLNNGVVTDLEVINYMNESFKTEKRIMMEKTRAEESPTEELDEDEERYKGIGNTISNYMLVAILLMLVGSFTSVIFQISVKYIFGFIIIDLLLYLLLNAMSFKLHKD